MPLVVLLYEIMSQVFRNKDIDRHVQSSLCTMTERSSAGLRVLLMMYKSLKDKSQFKLLNVSDEVKEILETTGFDQFLL